MTDKEKIRAEIERQMQHHVCGYKNALKDILKFIDSLPEEPVSEDLEEFATQLANEYFPDELNIWARPNHEARYLYDACIRTANWQKEQMMKDAVEGEITDDVLSKHLHCDAGKFIEAWDKFNSGDKVKIIIIKEEEK